ncbi:MAG: DNA polymerase III subunit beta [Proteobacteria bacterium]|nr:DNA polymerase III subunit beta [Pseudomonadota bacterium]
MLTISSNKLYRPLQAVTGIVERRHTLPILSNVLWELNTNSLVLTATDMEIQVQVTIDITPSTTETSITLPARKLLDIIRTLQTDSVLTIGQKETSVKIETGNSKFNLQTLPAADYPRLADANKDKEIIFSLSQSELKEKLLQVHYSMATQDIRYYLNGLLIQKRGSTLEFVATDGHRLGYVSKPLQDSSPDTQFIVPRKAVQELIKLLEEGDSLVKIRKGETQVTFDLGSIELTTKLVEGTFPDYQRVIPKGYTKSFSISREELLHALQRAAVLANEKFRGVRWVLSDNLLRVACTNADQEEAEEELAIEYSYDPMDIGFNINYLIDVLNNTKVENINCAVADENSSMLITIPGNQSFKYVVMPMKI